MFCNSNTNGIELNYGNCLGKIVYLMTDLSFYLLFYVHIGCHKGMYNIIQQDKTIDATSALHKT